LYLDITVNSSYVQLVQEIAMFHHSYPTLAVMEDNRNSRPT